MKAVLMAFSPEECEKIFCGEMTVDVRKVAPRLKAPYKVYMYESLGKKISCRKCATWCPMRSPFGCNEGAGAVVGEFVCGKIDELVCLSYQEVIEYFCKPEELDGKKVKALHGLHITAPKRYDTPKALSEFRKPDVWYKTETDNTSVLIHETGETITRPPQSWMYVEEIEE